MMVASARPITLRGLGTPTASSDLVTQQQRLDVLFRWTQALTSRPFMSSSVRARLVQMQSAINALLGDFGNPSAPPVADAAATVDAIEREVRSIDADSRLTMILTSVGISFGFIGSGILIWKYTKKGPR